VLTEELADPKLRGLMLCGIYTSIFVGIVIISICGTFMYWRTASGIATVLAFLCIIALLFINESPMWLVRKNQHKRAEKVLRYLWGPGNEIK
ncbi:hypothetical protein L9F63_004325, partial [Diploptera punctata]